MENINEIDKKEIMAKITELNEGILNIIEAQRLCIHATYEVKEVQQADDKRIETLKNMCVTLLNQIKLLNEKVKKLEDKTTLLN